MATEKHIYVLIYTGHVQGLMTAQRVILGAEEISAEALGMSEHPAPDVNLYAYIQARPECQASSTCTPLKMQSHAHHSAGVTLLPGSDFGMAPNQLNARLAFVDFDGALALQQVKLARQDQKAFIKTCCPRLVEACDRMEQRLASLEE